MQKDKVYRSFLQVFAVSLITSGFVLSADANEWKTRIITFDAPGAGTGFNQGTLPLAITPEGVIMGLYRDANNLSHGFLFSP
jgi:hypothetical protein